MMSSMRRFVMLVFLGLPLLEIVVLIQVGQAIGVWATLGLLILAAVAGMMVIRQQGVSMVGRMFDAMSEGRLAVGSIVDSYTRIVAGCLLIVPGFITDALGLALLVPPLRALMLRAMLPGLAGPRRAETTASDDRSQPARPIVIEGTYKRLDDDRDPKA
jgi:UPF0716 protein FxsA